MTFTAWNFANKKARDAYHAETKCPMCGAPRPVHAITNGHPGKCDPCIADAKRAYQADQDRSKP